MEKMITCNEVNEFLCKSFENKANLWNFFLQKLQSKSLAFDTQYVEWSSEHS